MPQRGKWPDADGLVRCSMCGERKSFEREFYPSSRNVTGREGRCKDCSRARSRAYERAKTGQPGVAEQRKAASARYRAANLEATQHYQRAWARNHRQTRRLRVLEHYGRACACCGETEVAFLCIDHVDGGGNSHRREIGAWVNIYRWLEDHGYPDGFQTLCHNCNFAKAHGGCPHQE